MAKKAVEEAKPARRMPDMTGVPGELVDVASLPPDVIFGNRKISPYVVILTKLRDSPAQILKFGDTRARASVWAQAKKLGIPVECAEVGGLLYVRIKDFHGDKGEARRSAIMLALKPGMSLPAPGIAAKLRESGDKTIDGAIVGAILEQMARTGEVIKQEGGTWRRK